MIEKMKEAVLQLEHHCGGRCNAEYNPCADHEAADGLRTVIAQLEASEPVAKVFICSDCQHPYVDAPPSQCDCLGNEQYTEGYIYIAAPVQPEPTRASLRHDQSPVREPLTQDEIDQIAANMDVLVVNWTAFARAIEAAHGIT